MLTTEKVVVAIHADLQSLQNKRKECHCDRFFTSDMVVVIQSRTNYEL